MLKPATAKIAVTLTWVSFCLSGSGCDGDQIVASETANSDPCRGQVCSGHGVCAVVGINAAVCICDVNYHPVGLECLENEGPKKWNRALLIHEWGQHIGDVTKVQQHIRDAIYMNCDAVLLQTQSSTFFGVMDPNYNYIDPRSQGPYLEGIVPYAHENNVQVYVMLSVDTGGGPTDGRYVERVLFGHDYDFLDIDNTNSGYKLDLAFEPLRRWEIDLGKFIAGRYPDLDGLMLPFPCYPYTESYSLAMRGLVQARFGYDPRSPPPEKTADQVKQDIRACMLETINEFIREYHQAVQDINPSIAVIASGPADRKDNCGCHPDKLYRAADLFCAEIYALEIEEVSRLLNIYGTYVPTVDQCVLFPVRKTVNLEEVVNPVFRDSLNMVESAGKSTIVHSDFVVDTVFQGISFREWLHQNPHPNRIGPVF